MATAEVRPAMSRQDWSRRARFRVRLMAGASLLGCLVVMVGWFTGSTTLTQGSPDLASMKMLTAIGLGLVAGGVLLGSHRAAPYAHGAAVVLGMAVLVEYLLDADLGIDQLLVTDPNHDPTLGLPGRPAQSTALVIVLLGVSGLLRQMGNRRAPQAFAAVAVGVGMVAIYGYAFGVEELYSLGPMSAMAVNTAAIVFVLASATWLDVPEGALQWLSFGEDSGARLLRVLVPIAIVVLPLVSWLVLTGERADLYPPEEGLTLLVALLTFALLAAGYAVARSAHRRDVEREQLLAQLHTVNAELESRVRSRSLQLNRQRTKLALLEERDRIARDLHDRVIQRVFAAGLQVASLGRTIRKQSQQGEPVPLVAEGLDSVAVELDYAIREMRNSIFQLTSVDSGDSVDQTLHDISVRASRILGFMPRVEVAADVPPLNPDLVAQLASVVQEGLSNIARHAQAASASVQLLLDEHDLVLRISDDGIGLPDPLPRSSGISNLMNRARNLGGEATWVPNQPAGTVLTWSVPRELSEDEPASADGFVEAVSEVEGAAPLQPQALDPEPVAPLTRSPVAGAAGSRAEAAGSRRAEGATAGVAGPFPPPAPEPSRAPDPTAPRA